MINRKKCQEGEVLSEAIGLLLLQNNNIMSFCMLRSNLPDSICSIRNELVLIVIVENTVRSSMISQLDAVAKAAKFLASFHV